VGPKQMYTTGGRPIAIAHRGGALEAIENTLEAFSYAVELGFSYVETDAQLTRDGVPVAFHDPRLERVSYHTGKISDLTFEQLRNVKIQGTGTISSVSELFDTFPSTKFNIDAKSDAVLGPLLDVVDEHDAHDRVCIASFYDRRIRRVRKRFGDSVFTSCGPLELTSLRLPGRRERLTPVARAAQVPRSIGPIPIITKNFVDTVHASGRLVHVWTIDDPDAMHDLFDLGVDGIMTDRPSVLKQVMTERQLW